MTTLWFILVAFMLTMYVVLDGFDLGAGMLHLFIAASNAERRTILRAIGPVWDGNEVWLIAAGGTLFFTFPILYASSFSGFYLPLFMVLWLLMIRGIAIELRSHFPNPVWTAFWDGLFALGSTLLAFFYGVALANVVRGVPLNAHHSFFEALWTNFSPANSNPGILDWYTILIGLLAVFALLLHGAAYIALKTTGELNTRAHQAGRRAWQVTLAVLIIGTLATFLLRPMVLFNFTHYPWGLVFPLAALAGFLFAGWSVYHNNDQWAFTGSSFFIIGMLSSTAFALYPDVLPATNPSDSLTIANAAAPQYGLIVGLIWWIIGIILALLYFTIIYRLFRGKVSVPAESH